MIYLDCAATSFQKPKTVYAAVQQAMHTMASPGRGGYGPAMKAADTAYACREAVQALFHVPEPEQVVFTCNATHALNLAIHGLVSPQSRVVVSGYEHNSVMRPLHHIGAELSVVSTPLFDPDAMLRGFAEALPGADVCICTGMSNVFGYGPPIEAIGALCRVHGVKYIVDASQLAGCGSLDFGTLGADFVAMPGHKSLLGPQGTGILLCREPLPPLMQGGTGSDSAIAYMPDYLPDGLEAGTHNIPGLAGLLAGVQYVLRRGTKHLAAHEKHMEALFLDRLKQDPKWEIFTDAQGKTDGAVVSLRYPGVDCEALASALGKSGVCVRAGLHCAPFAHKTAGTFSTGTVRFSFSPFICANEANLTAEITKRCVNNLKI